jgi:hypothetical protein
MSPPHYDFLIKVRCILRLHGDALFYLRANPEAL